MIDFDKCYVMNFENAMRGARNPMNSWEKSDSYYDDKGQYILGENDLSLAKRLRNAGTSDHRKFIRQIMLSVDITAPLYWWKEYDTYKVHSKPFEINDFSHDHLSENGLNILKNIVNELEKIRLEYIEKKDKALWYDLIQLLPSSYNQMRTCTLNYETLVNIYKSRKNHKLDEWRSFCEWIKTLPYAKEIIIAEE